MPISPPRSVPFLSQDAQICVPLLRGFFLLSTARKVGRGTITFVPKAAEQEEGIMRRTTVPTGDDVGVKVPPVFLPPDDFLDLLVGLLQEEGGQGSLRFKNQFDLHQG